MRSARSLAAILITAISLGACTAGAGSPNVPGAGPGDAQIPGFSNGNAVANPYLPLRQSGRWLYEGTLNGKTYLVEMAVTDALWTIEWASAPIDTMVARRRSWVDGVLTSETREFFAQGDDGGVWSFGRYVDRFREGQPLDHDGSWWAGVDGALPTLVMPGDPRVGQVFTVGDQLPGGRAEIRSLSEPTRTLDGPVSNGLLVAITHPDGNEETRVFVPGVGEVLAQSAGAELHLVERLADPAESAVAATFSTPTMVDNPYFGVAGVDYRLYFGKEDGLPLRIEVAPTGETKTVEWAGGTTETVVSQFTATSNRNLLEIAVDWFAQDDAGNVWYFGEDVWNYEQGRVADTHGTWIAGADGPPGMIMPGNPTLGQRFNPENIPGLVFETVAVKALDQTYGIPAGGQLSDVLVLHETLDDGSEETKFYAAGYGNLNVRVPGVETVDIVYALPNDAIDASRPTELGTMFDELRVLSLHGRGNVAALRHAYERFVARGDAVPAILIELASDQLASLEQALGRADRHESRATAMDLERTVLDIARLYRTDVPVDLEVLDLLARRMVAAVAAGDPVAAATAAALARGVVERNVTTFTGVVAHAAMTADAAADAGDLAGIAAAARKLLAATA